MRRGGGGAWLAALGVLALGCGPAPRPAVRTLDLDGAWEMRAASDSSWTAATVPGDVHTDLLAAGTIPDPLTGDHEAALAWIEKDDWVYRRTFQVDPGILGQDRVDLLFEGLDTWARVTLNGVPVLDADDQFRTWRVDVKRALRRGENSLEVRFDSPVRRGRERAAAAPWPIPHQEPDTSATRAYSRKAAYQFGWDWGPRYPTSGIWRPVRLEAWSGVRIVDAWAGVPTWTGDTARVALHVELATSPEAGSVRLGVRSPDDAFVAQMTDVGRQDEPAGLRTVTVPLVIPDGQRWWPRGAGEPAGRLYDVTVDAVSGRRWDRATRHIGLREVTLLTRPDSVGESFRFRVNGRPVFVRGANLVPPDAFPSRADSAAWARLVDDAVEANMNMVRVWGGGVYPPDVFYDLADERGILVWQDFMFANTLVPGDSAFLATTTAEASDQVRRLRRHPSLALWCGNNEIAEGWANWGWKDAYAPDVATQVEAAYTAIFHDTLPAVVAREDPDVAYWPSSPRIGWGHPESLTEGDSHYWGVWWGLEPFRAYAEKIPRFASEFGFQALPDPATLAAFGDPAPTRLGDPVMRAHQKHPTGYETMRTYLERRWPVPPDDSLAAWSYVSQLAQAEGVGLALEAHRRSWPRTGGTLFWQLNDTWPVVSWSSVDALGRWKALHYEARRVFAPVAVLADRWADTLAVWVAADTALAGTLEIRALDFDGRPQAERDVPVTLPPAADGGTPYPVLAWRGARRALLPGGTDPRRTVVVARLRAGGGGTPSSAERGKEPVIASDRAFFVDPKALALTDPDVRATASAADGRGWIVRLTSARFSFAAHLSVDGVGARFSDNDVDVLPGDTVRIRVWPEAPVPDLPARLRVRTLLTTLPRR